MATITMVKVEWHLGTFCVCFPGKYSDFYHLESDLYDLCGSEDFYGSSTEEWFLMNKHTKRLEYMLLTVPGSIEEPVDYSYLPLLQENRTWLDNFCEKNKRLYVQDNAYFSLKENKLLVCSSKNTVNNRFKLTDYFYILLDKHGNYSGFLLDNAISHISSNSNIFDEKIFKACLTKMLFFCRDEIYDAMDIQETRYLIMLEELEKECLMLYEKDGRLEHILLFVKNVKFAFYDIEQ
jgi:hypothetical protein